MINKRFGRLRVGDGVGPSRQFRSLPAVADTSSRRLAPMHIGFLRSCEELDSAGERAPEAPPRTTHSACQTGRVVAMAEQRLRGSCRRPHFDPRGRAGASSLTQLLPLERRSGEICIVGPLCRREPWGSERRADAIARGTRCIGNINLAHDDAVHPLRRRCVRLARRRRCGQLSAVNATAVAARP